LLRPWNSNRAPSSIEAPDLTPDLTLGLTLGLTRDPILDQTQGPILDPIPALILALVDGSENLTRPRSRAP